MSEAIPSSTEERNVYCAIATYDDLELSRSVQILEKVYETLIKPYLVNRTDLQFKVTYSKRGSDRFREMAPNVLNWRRILTESSLGHFSLIVWREDNSKLGRSSAVGGLTLNCSDEPEMASSLEFDASVTDLYDGHVSSELQKRIVALAKQTFLDARAVNGYITMDYLAANCYGASSPYELMVALSYPWASREFRRYVRGYFWGNLLSIQHVDLLGGFEYLKRAPVELIETLNSQGCYLQLSSDINHIDRDALRSLKAFLDPLLPIGYPKSRAYGQRSVDYLL